MHPSCTTPPPIACATSPDTRCRAKHPALGYRCLHQAGHNAGSRRHHFAVDLGGDSLTGGWDEPAPTFELIDFGGPRFG
jgi:hypothetical protein